MFNLCIQDNSKRELKKFFWHKFIVLPMKKFLIFALLVIITTFLLQSCIPLIQYTPFLPPKETKPKIQSIYVFKQNDPLPKYATILGEIYIGDTGFSTGHICLGKLRYFKDTSHIFV